jgi:hypothetical protein
VVEAVGASGQQFPGVGHVAIAAFGPTDLAAAGDRQGMFTHQQNGGGRHLAVAQQRCADRRKYGIGIELRTLCASHFADQHDLFDPLALAAESSRALGNQGRVAVAGTGFQILRIQISSGDDDEVLEPAGNKQLTIHQRTEIAGAVPGGGRAGQSSAKRRAIVLPPITRRRARTRDPDLADFSLSAADPAHTVDDRDASGGVGRATAHQMHCIRVRRRWRQLPRG